MEKGHVHDFPGGKDEKRAGQTTRRRKYTYIRKDVAGLRGTFWYPHLKFGLELLHQADARSRVGRDVDARDAEVAGIFRGRLEEVILFCVGFGFVVVFFRKKRKQMRRIYGGPCMKGTTECTGREETAPWRREQLQSMRGEANIIGGTYI